MRGLPENGTIPLRLSLFGVAALPYSELQFLPTRLPDLFGVAALPGSEKRFPSPTRDRDGD